MIRNKQIFQQGAPLGRDADGNSGFAPVNIFDERRFHDVLTDWMLVAECAPDLEDAKFLRLTHLDKALTVEQFSALRNDDAAPDQKLADHLVAIYDYYVRENGNSADIKLPSDIVFRNRALHTTPGSTFSNDKKIISLDESLYSSLRLFFIESMLSHNITPISVSTTHPLTPKILAAFREFQQEYNPGQNSLGDSEIIAKLKRSYEADPEQTKGTIEGMLLPEQINVDEWAEYELADHLTQTNVPLQIMRFLKCCAGKTTTEWIKSTGFSMYDPQSTVLRLRQIPLIHDMLPLNEQEIRRLAEIAVDSPTISLEGEHTVDGLQQLLRHPALSPRWLHQQPEEKHLALLVSEYKKRKYSGSAHPGATTSEAVEFDLAHFTDFKERYGLTDMQSVQLACLSNPLLTPELALKYISCEADQYLAWPALDEEWLRSNPVHQWEGLLLEGYCARRSISSQALGDYLGITRQAVSNWKRFISSIGVEKIPDISRFLELTKEEENKLLEARIPGLIDSWLDAQPLRKQAGILAKSYRERVGISAKDCAASMQETIEAFSLIERGARPFNSAFQQKLTALLNLSNEEIRKLEAKISLRESVDVDTSFDWLTEYPIDDRAGALLLEFRGKLSRIKLAKILGVEKSTVSGWEKGTESIPAKQLIPIKNALKLGDENFSLLIQTTFNAPTKEDLQSFAPYQRAGILLAAFRHRLGLSQHDLGEKTRLAQSVISIWERGAEVINAKYIESLIKELYLSQDEKKQLLHTRFPALNPEWLDEQPMEKRAGLLLAAYRERNAMTQQHLATALGDTLRHVKEWENEWKPMNVQFIPNMANLLGVNAEEEQRLMDQIQLRIHYERTKNNSLRALDPVFLCSQPESLRVGLLLKAYRTRLGISPQDVENDLSLLDSTYRRWESSANEINTHFFPALKKLLGLDDDEYHSLLTLRLPALSDEWLNQQPVEKQAGLLLRTYRLGYKNYLGLTSKNLAEKLEISLAAYSRIECGSSPMDHAFLTKIEKILELSEDQSNSISRAIDLSQRKSSFPPNEWFEAQPIKLRPGLYLKALRADRNMTQDDLTTFLGLSKGHISQWEVGTININQEKLPLIREKLSLSDTELTTLTQYIEGRKNYREEVIIPDADKLKAFPDNKQAGILLGAFRERKGLTVKSLGLLLGLSPSLIIQWEAGKKPITLKRLPALQNYLDISCEELTRLMEAMDRRKLAIIGASSTTGASMPASALPKTHSYHDAREIITGMGDTSMGRL